MAPVRRYLRITKYSALECRIYVDNPSLAQSWLLHPRHNILPRVIEAVRPLVLPKLQEERERARKKTGAAKKKSIKDVVVTDDFEVSVYLIETPIRHSLLAKHKQFRDKKQTRLKSNSTKLLGGDDREGAIDVDAIEQVEESVPYLRVEDSDEDAVVLDAIPAAPAAPSGEGIQPPRAKRRRAATINDSEDDESNAGEQQELEVIASAEEYDDDDGEEGKSPPTKRHKSILAEEEDGDKKKKLAMDISYEGFSIYGRVLCLVVKKREKAADTAKGKSKAKANVVEGQATVDNWISSTQMPAMGE
ncbi:hypothetical protein MKZ38_004603 [Zalerion maritima]|uniref:Uncharacterized protein n=1 Tax=Zalerion maritima TaxID=339359 RepID=A0AAD5RY47_9PEZI|nr:hypothetical protein MKZ38_004603 [Zalerion maritima]